jgi:hypothetical protein
MVQNSVPAKEQYGFRSDSSTDKASYILKHEVLNALNSKKLQEVSSVV